MIDNQALVVCMGELIEQQSLGNKMCAKYLLFPEKRPKILKGLSSQDGRKVIGSKFGQGDEILKAN